MAEAMCEGLSMTRYICNLARLAASFFFAVCLSASEPRAASVSVRNIAWIVDVARDACFDHGDSTGRLNEFAIKSGWVRADQAEIDLHHTPLTIMVGAWTFLDGARETAIFQSVLRPPHEGAVCSITTGLASDTEHLALKDAFSRLFGTTISEETEKTSLHIDRYWIDRGRAPPVKTTLSYDRVGRMITIRMIHGPAYPMAL